MLRKLLLSIAALFGAFIPTYAMLFLLNWFAPVTFWQKFTFFTCFFSPLVVVQLVFFVILNKIFEWIWKTNQLDHSLPKSKIFDWDKGLKELIKEERDNSL